METVSKALQDAVILIPSLEPDGRLPAYIRTLLDSGFGHIVVVDDGSSEKYQPIFNEIAGLPRCQVLHHDVNHGKGVALKTGYTWILSHLPDISGVITADADGQHTVPDCIRLAEKLKTGERALYLGTRDFSLPNVPPRSRAGNRSTSIIFFLLYGQWLQDTQTGLRAFRREDLQMMADVEGERFEYEMNVLIACTRKKLPIVQVPIDTVYENDNSGSHYNAWKDSLRILKVILGGFVKFMGASLLCFLIDQGIFNLMNLAVFHNGARGAANLILASTVIARVISAAANFMLNKNLVFHQHGHTGRALTRYLILCVGIMLLSATGVWLLGLIGVHSTVAKLIVDFLLYFVSYRFQQCWVFKA